MDLDALQHAQHANTTPKCKRCATTLTTVDDDKIIPIRRANSNIMTYRICSWLLQLAYRIVQKYFIYYRIRNNIILEFYIRIKCYTCVTLCFLPLLFQRSTAVIYDLMVRVLRMESNHCWRLFSFFYSYIVIYCWVVSRRWAECPPTTDNHNILSLFRHRDI